MFSNEEKARQLVDTLTDLHCCPRIERILGNCRAFSSLSARRNVRFKPKILTRRVPMTTKLQMDGPYLSQYCG
jgi:hypothetical protein